MKVQPRIASGGRVWKEMTTPMDLQMNAQMRRQEKEMCVERDSMMGDYRRLQLSASVTSVLTP